MKLIKQIAVALVVMLPASLSAAPTGDSNMIKVDGSSTVYPITEAVAEEFGHKNRKARITVGISGTGGGFKKFCTGETDFQDASRPIKSKEVELCGKNGIEYIEVPVAYDALSVVVNPQNDWAKTMTVQELKKIWEPEAQGKITHWNQIRNEWPDKKIALFGPGVDSGTYDYFTKAIVGTEHASRGDFTSSEDDNVLVQGVANNKYALGFFGMAYYQENKDKLAAVAIDDGNDSNGKGGILPTTQTVENDTYKPLARPLFLYVSKQSLARPLIKEFMDFYLDNASSLSSEVGYVKLPDEINQLAKARISKMVVGSIFAKDKDKKISLAKRLELTNGS